MALSKEEQAVAERLYLRHKSKVQSGKMVRKVLRDLIGKELEDNDVYAKAKEVVKRTESILWMEAKRQAVKLSKEG